MLRTGSFPLSQLAELTGADYGDVLVIAHYQGASLRGEPLTAGRLEAAEAAWARLRNQVQPATFLHLIGGIEDHAYRRWSSDRPLMKP